jgi:hypothetical protein
MKYTSKKALVTTPIFMQFQKILGLYTGMLVKNILFVNNCATHLQDTSFVWNIIFLYYTPNCTSAVLSIRTEFSYMLKIQSFELDCFQLHKSSETPYLNTDTNVTS